MATGDGGHYLGEKRDNENKPVSKEDQCERDMSCHWIMKVKVTYTCHVQNKRAFVDNMVPILSLEYLNGLVRFMYEGNKRDLSEIIIVKQLWFVWSLANHGNNEGTSTESIPHVLFGLFPDIAWHTVVVRRRLPSKKAIENAKQREEEKKT